jgi:hypothetical protein
LNTVDKYYIHKEAINGKCTINPNPIALSTGKAIPLQAWTGPEGSRRLKLSDLKTFGT